MRVDSQVVDRLQRTVRPVRGEQRLELHCRQVHRIVLRTVLDDDVVRLREPAKRRIRVVIADTQRATDLRVRTLLVEQHPDRQVLVLRGIERRGDRQQKLRVFPVSRVGRGEIVVPHPGVAVGRQLPILARDGVGHQRGDAVLRRADEERNREVAGLRKVPRIAANRRRVVARQIPQGAGGLNPHAARCVDNDLLRRRSRDLAAIRVEQMQEVCSRRQRRNIDARQRRGIPRSHQVFFEIVRLRPTAGPTAELDQVVHVAIGAQPDLHRSPHARQVHRYRYRRFRRQRHPVDAHVHAGHVHRVEPQPCHHPRPRPGGIGRGARLCRERPQIERVDVRAGKQKVRLRRGQFGHRPPVVPEEQPLPGRQIRRRRKRQRRRRRDLHVQHVVL